MINLLEEGKDLQVDFSKRGGILPVCVQDAKSLQILMLAYLNQDALEKSLKSKKAHFYSTSRNKLWLKGKESGNTLSIQEILIDCDQDAFVYIVNRDKGGVCHTLNQWKNNRISCFYRSIGNNKQLIFKEL